MVVFIGSFWLNSCSSGTGGSSLTESGGTASARDMYFHQLAQSGSNSASNANSSASSNSSSAGSTGGTTSSSSHSSGSLAEPKLNSAYFNDSSSDASANSGAGGRDDSTGISLKYAIEDKHPDGQTELMRNNRAFSEGEAIRIHVKLSKPAYIQIFSKSSSAADWAPLDLPVDQYQADQDCVVPPHGEMVFDAKTGKEGLALIVRPQPPASKDLHLTEFSSAAGVAGSPESNTVGANALTGKPETVGSLSVYAAPQQGAKESDPYVYVNDPNFNKPHPKDPSKHLPCVVVLELVHGSK